MANSLRLNNSLSLTEKLMHLGWGLVIMIVLLAGIGFVALYSAAGGNMDPWASKQLMRFCVGLMGLFIIAMIDIKIWYRLTYPIFIVGFISLIIVEVMGQVGMGAQRWINLGFIQLQPSEFMKIAVVMALARYFHAASKEEMRKISFLLPSFILIALPVGLVLLQPDLGTSLMIIMAGISIIFLAGAPIWMFLLGGGAVAASIPVAWQFMHDYQKRRVMTFLDPESDPLGAGYHITQSKIAIGSGGVEGKGFLEGTQSRLNFLPEKQTDFIFTLWVEESGLIKPIACTCFSGELKIHLLP